MAGIFDFVTDPRFGASLMAAGEAIGAIESGKPANMKPYMALAQQMQQQRRNKALSERLAGPGILESLVPGMTPERAGILRGVMAESPGILAPYLMKAAAGGVKPTDPWAGYKVVGGSVVKMGPDGKVVEAYKAPVRPGMTVNVNPGGTDRGTWSKEMTKGYVKEWNAIRDTAADATNTLSQLARAKAIISNPDVYMGSGSETALNVKKILSGLGIGVKGVSPAEEMGAIETNLTLNMTKLLKGAISEGELAILQKGVAGLGDTKAGALAKIRLMEKAGNFQVKLAEAATAYAATPGKDGNPRGLDYGWTKVRNEMAREFVGSFKADMDGETTKSVTAEVLPKYPAPAEIGDSHRALMADELHKRTGSLRNAYKIMLDGGYISDPEQVAKLKKHYGF